MPRQKAVCAGGCGLELYGGSGSLPAGKRCCRECRASGLNPNPNKARPSQRSNRKCGWHNCDVKHFAKGFCRRHYYQARRDAGLDGARSEVLLLNGMASLHGAYFPKAKVLRCKRTVGLMVECPNCSVYMTGSPACRACPACGTTVVLNTEEVSWLAVA